MRLPVADPDFIKQNFDVVQITAHDCIQILVPLQEIVFEIVNVLLIRLPTLGMESQHLTSHRANS
jgi:hypothetical protein